MRLLIDNQLPLALAIHLRRRGHHCFHVIDLGLQEASDLELWTRAANDDFILVSKDEDFVFLANRLDDLGKLIWVRLGNCRNAALLEAFDRLHESLIAAVAAGNRVIEVR